MLIYLLLLQGHLRMLLNLLLFLMYQVCIHVFRFVATVRVVQEYIKYGLRMSPWIVPLCIGIFCV